VLPVAVLWWSKGTALVSKDYEEELSEQGAQVESDLGRVTLDSLSDADLQLVNALASAWDTLGWFTFRRERWKGRRTTSQNADIGDHLGQLYEKQGRQQAAIHVWQLALREARAHIRGAAFSRVPFTCRRVANCHVSAIAVAGRAAC
jgi:hypothetical protein